ncbi:MAG: heparin lyase I family protein [Myxococcota bacterium]
MKTKFYGVILGAALGLGPATANAAEVWVGDFETGDLSQWSFLLNNEVNGMDYAFAQEQTVGEGMFAAQIELHNDAAWPNGIKRVELQHSPGAGRTDEGMTTWFAWSFYVPDVLGEPPIQIGYWESNNTFQQAMSFEVTGETITFSTRRPNNVEQWRAEGAITAGEWHRLAMGVTWSTDPGQGAVDVWFDGEQVLDQGPAQTLSDNNPHFIQLGLLRNPSDFADVPIIIVDDAVEGDTLEDVRPDAVPGMDGGSGSGSSGGSMADTSGGMNEDTTGGGSVDSSGGGGETLDPPGTGGGMVSSGSTPTSGATTAGGGGSDDDDSGGCGCRSDRAPSGGWALLLLAWIGWRRRARAA